MTTKLPALTTVYAHAIASGSPEFSPCTILKSGSHTVAARLLTRPFRNGGSGKIKWLSCEHSIARPYAVGSSSSIMYAAMTVETGVILTAVS